MRRRARQMARTMNSGVKCAYWVHAGEARELGRRDQLLEVLPEGFPALREGFLGRSAEEVVGEFARAEGREEGETVSACCSSSISFGCRAG